MNIIYNYFWFNDDYIWFRSRISQTQGWGQWKRLAYANEIVSSDGTQTGTIVDVNSGTGNTED